MENNRTMALTKKQKQQAYTRHSEERDRKLAPPGIERKPFEPDAAFFLRVAWEWKTRAEAAGYQPPVIDESDARIEP